MSVYKPKNSPYWQYDFVYQGHRFHGSTGKTTRRDAKAAEKVRRDRAILEVLSGEIDKPAVFIPTLDQAAAEWWAFKGSGLKSANTLETRLAAAVVLVGKSKAVNAITTSDIAAAIQKRRGKLVRGRTPIKHATANRDIIDTIRPIIRRQENLLNDGVTMVPFPKINWQEVRLPEPKPRARDFSAGDIEAVVFALPSWWQDFARFQALYGCRLSEMFFPLGDVDVSRASLRLRERKGADDHYLPLTAQDASMLAARIGRARAAKLSTVWFRELKGGRLKALTYNGAKQALRRAMRDAGLHAAHGAKGSHDLRHHAGMQVLRKTKNLRTAQKWLGHADIKSTLVYAHALDDDLRAALDLLSRPAPEVGLTEPAENELNPLHDKAKTG